MKVCHLTSVHPRNDARIFIKECQSIVKNGFDVSLIVADDKGNETISDVSVYDVGKQSSRLKRVNKTPKDVYKKALEINADVYHFHDPELIKIGSKLIKKGKKVIYDVHEDVPRQFLHKPYLFKLLRIIISFLFEKYENNKSKNFSYILTATDHIKSRFLEVNNSTETIMNYPIFEELKSEVNWSEKENTICYIGSISKVRGIVEIVKALEKVDGRLELAGSFNDLLLESEVKKAPSWNKVNEYGFVGRKEIREILSKTKVGLVTLHPIINYLDAMPVKMFEYMASGIPIIASNIPLWAKIIEENNCGISVDPYNTEEIADACNQLLRNDDTSKLMGENGIKAVKEKFNWGIEEEKLIKIYNSLR
jgi:glycosyltransferase involved in cell wall biosynthesis